MERVIFTATANKMNMIPGLKYRLDEQTAHKYEALGWGYVGDRKAEAEVVVTKEKTTKTKKK